MIFLDWEARSRADLERIGGRRYAADDTTEVVCCVALDLRVLPAVIYVWSPWPGPLRRWQPRAEHLNALGIATDEIAYAEPLLSSSMPPAAVLQAAAQGVPFCAHNADGFDSHIWNARGLPPVEWIDTVPLCRRKGLPGHLDGVGRALFDLGKDRVGREVMLRTMKPQPKRRKPASDWRFLDPDGPRLSVIVRYCIRDVLLMAQAFCTEDLDAPHIDDPVLAAHRAIDARGVQIDLPLASLLHQVDALSVQEVVDACPVGEEVLRSPMQLIAWLADRGVEVPNAQAPTMRGLLS